jgi:predicted RNase H-like nuclease (RuvC/YqgF family)
VILKDNETAMRKEIQALRTQISTLQDRLSSSREEIQKLETSIQRSVEPQLESQGRDTAIEEAGTVKEEVQHAEGRTWTSRVFGDNLYRKLCSNCGRQLKPEDRYCDSCGRPVAVTT